MVEPAKPGSKDHEGFVEVVAVEWRAQIARSAPTFSATGSEPRAYQKGVQLAPNLPILLAQLVSMEDDFNRWKTSLGRLPYSLGGMHYAFMEFARIQSEPGESYRLAPNKAIDQNGTEPLSFMIDMFLNHALRASYGVCAYLDRRYRSDLKGHSLDFKSMNRFVGRLRHLPHLLPLEREPILNFWDIYGNRLKEYRDLAEHQSLLAPDCRFYLSQDGSPLSYMPIPDNPGAGPKNLVYGNPPVHAFLYMRRTFYAIVKFVNELTNLLIDPSKPDNLMSIGPIFVTPIKLGNRGQRAVRIATVEELDKELEHIFHKLHTPMEKG